MRNLTKLCILLVCSFFLCNPVFAFDFTLQIYGNANMDDSLDSGDITYLQGILSGAKEKTDLADTNHDGTIDEQDVTQLELLLTGDESSLTLIDHAGRTVTIPMPVNRVVSGNTGDLRSMVALGALDKVVGICSETKSDANNQVITQAYPEILNLPDIGKYREPSPESIITLQPDILFYAPWVDPSTVDALQESAGVPVICLGPSNDNLDGQKGVYDSWRLAGTILGTEERADELIKSSEDEIKKITDITSGISDGSKPRIFYGDPAKAWVSTVYQPIEIAGGVNVGVEAVGGSNPEVSKEQIIEWNPDIILLHGTRKDATVEEFLNDPLLQSVTAVKNGDVYYTMDGTTGYDIGYILVMCPYLAKIFYPDQFSDLDIKAEGNQILKMLYGVDNLYPSVEKAARGELYQGS